MDGTEGREKCFDGVGGADRLGAAAAGAAAARGAGVGFGA